jgi:hypothetical protein
VAKVNINKQTYIHIEITSERMISKKNKQKEGNANKSKNTKNLKQRTSNAIQRLLLYVT